MYRAIIEKLKEWKESSIRKPLILRGARQVGKTWLLKHFGRDYYKNTVYINFEDSPNLKTLFSQDFSIDRIIKVLEIHSQTKISVSDTLIIFDEIQEAEKGVTVLKYFSEHDTLYHVAAAGSLLGISFHQHISFPVGKVDFLDLYPMSFYEFLMAAGENNLVELIQQEEWETLTIFRDKILDYLREYYFVGGMPEVVETYCITKDFVKVRQIQNRLLLSYEGDFSKHAPYEIVPRIRMVWQSIPKQLAKENKKFIYGVVREGSRAKDFELAIQWLTDCGLLVKCHHISKPEMPLVAFSDLSSFKLYLHDVGLLVAMAGIDIKSIIKGNSLFTQFNGAISEQYVIQQLILKSDRYIGYWTNDRNTAEVDFVIQDNGRIIPIEVKSGENLKSKSFKLFCQKYMPEVALRSSLSDYKQEEWMTNIPLWCIGNV